MRAAVVLVGVLCALAAAPLDRRGLPAWLGPDDLAALRTTGALLVVTGALLTLAASHRVRGLGGMVAAAGLVPSGIAAVEALRTGLPGPATAVLAVGLAVASAGALARVTGPPPGPATRRRRLLAGGVAAALTTAVAVPAAVAVDDLAVRSGTAAPVAPAPVPGRAGSVRWTWSTGEDVDDVRAAGAGVVVATERGVVALDGTTGAERWRFDRTGAAVRLLAVSPDGATVVVEHDARAAEAGVLTALDAMTGTRRWDTPVGDGVPLLTGSVVAMPEPRTDDNGPRADRLVVRALDTGAVRWTWDPPAGCGHLVLRSLTVRGVVPVETDCAGVVVLRGLDEADGTERWATELTRPSPAGGRSGPGLPPSSAPDGSTLLVSTATGFATLDPATGRVLARVPSGFPRYGAAAALELLDGNPERVVATLDPVTGALAPVPPGCPDEVAATWVAGSVVRICRTDRLEVRVDGTAPPGGDLGRPFRDRVVALDPLRDTFIVAAPGAVAVAVADLAGTVVGLG